MKKRPNPINLSAVTTYPLQERINKVSIHDFATVPSPAVDLSPFLENLPRILKAPRLFGSR